MSIVLLGSSSGSVTLQEPAVAGSTVINLPATSGTMASISSVTANGVLYVNSSSQPTSGSALVFDGTNLGLGVTPSAWSSTWRALDVDTRTAIISAGNKTSIFANNAVFESAGWKYKASQFAGSYAISTTTGNHEWSTAPSGTAGNAITFTQAMTLDASGRLAIGQTSGTQRLTVNSSMDVTDGTVTTRLSQAGGAALIGTSTNHAFFFMTNDTERARIASAGGLSIAGGLAVGTLTSYPSNFFLASAVLSAGAGTYPLKWNSSNGIVTYDTSSRLVKENIEDSPYGLDEVLQLKPRKYYRTDDQRNEIGLVADEVQAVMPEFVPLVEKSIFTKDESDTELIAGGVNYDKLTSVLIKAIQEQQAIIESQSVAIQALTQRITALEGA
jgi:hypothetical protein